jgi:hypothetical protein
LPDLTRTKKAGLARLFVRTTRDYFSGWSVFDVGDFWTVQQLNVSHWSVVANAETHFQDAQVTAVAVSVTWAQFREQFAYDFAVAQTENARRLLARVSVLPRVRIGSTTRRSSFAFGSVVLMAS